ncbi:MAG: hypothetical protein ABTQ27_04450 [Amaricoccus sp.]|uniref:hypothetical protein n=1 Tax=Amaricoccus sp. TaxID=1872485 RepID=UPI0033156C68
MTFIERSRAFATTATELDGLRRAANLVSAVGSRATQLESSLATFRLAAGQLRLLREQGVAVTVDLSPAAGFVHYLAALQAATAADPAAITAPEVSARTLAPLGAFTKTISDACEGAWRAHVTESLPRVGTDLIPVLARVPALRAKVERFQKQQNAAKAFADTLPQGAAAIDTFRRTAADCHAAWDALDAEGIPPRVTQFLRAATSEVGADLDSVDQEVTNWLAAQDLDRSFVIRAR